MTYTHLNVPRTAKLLAKWMAWLGLAAGVLYSVGGFFVDLLTVGLNWGTALAFGALVGMPVIFGALGFVGGALIALAAGGVGAVFEWLRR